MNLEKSLGEHLDNAHAVLSWIPRHATFLMNRFRVVKDCKTPYEIGDGKKLTNPLTAVRGYLFRPISKRDYENLGQLP